MTDDQLMALLISTITSGLVAQGFNVPVEQEYQPTLQGTPGGDSVFIWKLSENRYGFPGRSDKFATGIMTHMETERIEVMFQIGALAIQNPSNITSVTAADYVRAVGRTLQSDVAQHAMLSAGVGIYRIQAMRQPYFKDDKDNFESSPSFDFTVAYDDVYLQTEPSTGIVTGSVTIS